MSQTWEGDDRQADDGPEFDEPSDEALLAALRSALQPEPLSPALTQRIRAGWAATRASARPIRMKWLAPAIAAALATVFFVPVSFRSDRPGRDISLSPEEAQLVLAAFAGGRWYGLSDAAIERMLDDVNELSAELLPAAAVQGSDDWDLPRARDDSASPGSSRAGSAPHVVL